MENRKKNILIVGSQAKDYSLIKKLLSYDNVAKIVAAPGNRRIKDLCDCVDIREDNIKDLLDYVLENEIDLTIVTSEKAIKADISSFFQTNGQMVFAPSFESANFAISKSVGKKFLYRLRIPTPKFGIFDKPQLAVDYLKTSTMPVVIRTDESLTANDRLVCTSFYNAKTFVEDLFLKDEKKVLLEDYVYGHDFTFYVITDGYSALPFGITANYKFVEEGDGGVLTDGIATCVPDFKISKELEDNIMKNVVSRVLEALEQKRTPYIGILGIDCVLKNDGSYSVLEFRTFLSNHDCEAVLNLVEDNLVTLFEACAIGAFADDYSSLNISDNSSASCTLLARNEGKIITGIDLCESDITYFDINKNEYLEYETISGKTLVITRTAKTLSRAKKYLLEDLEVINFEGKKFRKDIFLGVDIF